ncbi:MAG TPA: DUF192 domain-containing protein [Acidimicrobiia bacterium]
MSSRARLAAGAAGLLVVVGIGLYFLGDALTSDDDSGASRVATKLEAAVAHAKPAVGELSRLSETTVHVGDEQLRVAVADDEPERHQGLRGRNDIAGYGGMLFVFDAPTSTPFTMSTVRTPLDIGFYAADGHAVDRLRMEPCRFAASDCPLYRADGSFSYAIETLPGDLPFGRLSG